MDVQLYKILTNIIQQYIIDSVNPQKIRITCSKSINAIQLINIEMRNAVKAIHKRKQQ